MALDRLMKLPIFRKFIEVRNGYVGQSLVHCRVLIMGVSRLVNKSPGTRISLCWIFSKLKYNV
jgi:hypothetical protein